MFAPKRVRFAPCYSIGFLQISVIILPLNVGVPTEDQIGLMRKRFPSTLVQCLHVFLFRVSMKHVCCMCQFFVRGVRTGCTLASPACEMLVSFVAAVVSVSFSTRQLVVIR